MRLIDADALLAHMKQTPRYFTVKADIEDAPTVEAARCRDCEHSYEDLDGYVCSYGSFVDLAVPEDFYCKNSARKNPRKPLAGWTLGELKAFCEESAGMSVCLSKRCPFSKMCDKMEWEKGGLVPGDWELEVKDGG